MDGLLSVYLGWNGMGWAGLLYIFHRRHRHVIYQSIRVLDN